MDELEYNPWQDYIPPKNIAITNKSPAEENVKPQVKTEENSAVYLVQAVTTPEYDLLNVEPFDDHYQQVLQKLVTSFRNICTKYQVGIEHIKFLKLIMDHFTLKWLQDLQKIQEKETLQKPIGKRDRWIMYHQQFNFKIIYMSNKENRNANTLSYILKISCFFIGVENQGGKSNVDTNKILKIF